MKTGIHPTYHDDTVVTCSCGEAFTTGSTVTQIHTELCSKCHPFYTGTQKLVDTAGRVERFRAKERAAGEKKIKLELQKEKRLQKMLDARGAPSVDPVPEKLSSKKKVAVADEVTATPSDN